VGFDEVTALIESASPDDQVDLIRQANTGANQIVRKAGETIVSWFEWMKGRLLKLDAWNERDIEDNFAELFTSANTFITQRDKKFHGRKRMIEAWKDDKRGTKWIEVYMNDKYNLTADTTITRLATLAQAMGPIQVSRLLNKYILERCRDYYDAKEDPTRSTTGMTKFERGHNGARVTSSDIRKAFTALKAKNFNAEQIELPTRADLDEFHLFVGPMGLLEMEGATPGLFPKLLTLGPDDSDAMFVEETKVVRDTQAPVDKGKAREEADSSFLSPAQQDNAASSPLGSNPLDPLNDKQREAAEMDQAIQASRQMHSEEELARARFGKRPETPIVVDDDPPEVTPAVKSYLDLVQKTSTARFSEQLEGSVIDLSGNQIVEREAAAARSNVRSEILKMKEDGADIDKLALESRRKLLEPGSVSQLSFKRPEKQLNVKNCLCIIGDHIKLRLEHGDPPFLAIPVKERVSQLHHLTTLGETEGGMCEFHKRLYGSYIGLNVQPKTNITVLDKWLLDVDSHRDDLASFRVGKGWEMFKKTAEAKEARKGSSLGPSKYAASTAPEYLHDHDKNDSILGTWLRGLEQEARIVGLAHVDLIDFSWLFKKSKRTASPLAELIDKEWRMYEHHCRSELKGVNHTGLMLPNMIYSIIQQLVRSDHGLYLATLAARGDKNTCLVAYPDYARSVPAAEEADGIISFTQVDIPDTFKYKTLEPPRISNRVCDFVVLGRPKNDGDEAMAPIEYHARLYTKTELYVKCKRNNRLHVIKPGSTSRLAAHLKKVGYLWEKVHDLQVGSIVLTRQGTPIRMAFLPPSPDDEKTPRLPFRVLSANYTALLDDGTLENGVPWSVLNQEVIHLRAPETPRWEDPDRAPVTSEPFRAVQTLTGLGPLSEALLGRLPWTDRGVIAERDRLLGMDAKEIEKHLADFRKLATQRAINAYDSVFHDEPRLYPDKRSFVEANESTEAAGSILEADEMFPKEKVQRFYEDEDFSKFRRPSDPKSEPEPKETPAPEEPIDDDDESSLDEPGSGTKKSRISNPGHLYKSTERITDEDLDEDVHPDDGQYTDDKDSYFSDISSVGFQSAEESLQPSTGKRKRIPSNGKLKDSDPKNKKRRVSKSFGKDEAPGNAGLQATEGADQADDPGEKSDDNAPEDDGDVSRSGSGTGLNKGDFPTAGGKGLIDPKPNGKATATRQTVANKGKKSDAGDGPRTTRGAGGRFTSQS
jgi:hypothetical protein